MLSCSLNKEAPPIFGGASLSCVLFLVGVYLLQVMLAEVAPVVIGGAVGADRQLSLLLIEQYLEKDVVVVRTAAVEDELHVGPHWEYVGAPPAFGLQLFQIVGFQVVAVDADEADERIYHIALSTSHRR